MRTATIVLAALMTSGLCGCARQLRTVDIDAPGYADGHLTGFELLEAVQDHAMTQFYDLAQLQARVERAKIDSPTYQRLHNQVDALMKQTLDCIDLGGEYNESRHADDAERRQVYRMIVDRLLVIQKKRLDIAYELHHILHAGDAHSQE